MKQPLARLLRPARAAGRRASRDTVPGQPASPMALTRRTKRSSPAASRAPAVQPKRDADATRARILQAAIDEFAAKGLSGARVDVICRAARANPRMLYHHFGDKARLYVSVLEHVLGELRREELKLEVDHVPPLQGMMQLFDFIHGHFGAHPQLIHLLSGENLLRGTFLRRSTKVPSVASPLIDLIAGLLRRGEQQGIMRAGIDPLHLYVVMVALSYFHRSNAHTLSAIFRTDLLAPAWQAQHKEFAVQLLERFLARSR
jgi:AcrR family transcriptional regulator